MLGYVKSPDYGESASGWCPAIIMLIVFVILVAGCGAPTARSTIAPGTTTAASAAQTSEAQLSGLVIEIVDGDTFDIGVTRIRPLGYDTPEEGKRCGTVNVYDEATATLATFFDGKIVNCIDTGKRDKNGRTVAVCSVDGIDLGGFMVASGWARDWPKYSLGKYCPQEREALSVKRGIWALDCPADVWDGRDYVNEKTGEQC